jgi:hypothetical protein
MSESVRTFITPSTGKPVSIIDGSETVPFWLVALHRLARLGKATDYGTGIDTQHKIARFDLSQENGDIIQAKWGYLADALSVSIIYKEKD